MHGYRAALWVMQWCILHRVYPGSEDCAVAIVSVVRTGMAWLFILSAVAWPEVGVRSASRTQAAVRRLWGKVALRRVWPTGPRRRLAGCLCTGGGG